MVMGMDTHNKLKQLLAEQHWTTYRLSKESGLSQSTIANIFKRNTDPNLTTLEAVCSGFGITLSQYMKRRWPTVRPVPFHSRT